MKLVIAGSRNLEIDEYLIDELCRTMLDDDPTEIVSGGSGSVDLSGEDYALLKGLPIEQFLADWDKFGKSAGPIRNRAMAEYGDALLLVWDGSSKGSANMKDEMEKLGKPVYEIILN
ncbi:MAG: hypothetical protein R3213_01935 [Flavobacteriaceae bacterium]|nr:hypothetical protein [Flavobacteriaceae bacterium]